MKNTDSVLTPAQKDALILALTEHVQSECSSVDMEQRFRDMLDECYSFEKIGGPFSHMSPSRVLEEVDPISFRCGVADHSDSENVYEIEGEYYDSDKVDEARESFLNDLRETETGLEMDVEAELDAEVGTEGTSEEQLAEVRAKIEAVENHAF